MHCQFWKETLSKQYEQWNVLGFEVKSPHHTAHMPEDMNGSRIQGRSEFVFSETSTEMSNSDSIRDGFPMFFLL